MFLDVQELHNGDATLILSASDGAELHAAAITPSTVDTADWGPVTLTQAGMYTVRVFWPAYEDRLLRCDLLDVPETDVREIGPDGTVTASISTPGEVDQWQFAVEANRSVFLDVQRITESGRLLDFTLLDPAENVVFSTTGISGSPDNADHGPELLTEAGIYTLVVDGQGDDTAGYQFEIVGAGPPQIVSHAGRGSTPSTINQVFLQFNQIMDDTTFSLATDPVTLVGSGGEIPVQSALWSEGKDTLILGFDPQPASGAYRFTVGPDIRNPAAEPMDQDRDEILGEALEDQYSGVIDSRHISLNEQVTGWIENSDSVQRWSFSALAGQQIRFDLIGLSNDQIAFDMFGSEEWIAFEGIVDDSPLVTLPADGTYYLIARGTGEQVRGTYTFRLQESVPTDIELGTPYYGEIRFRGQTQLFRVIAPSAQPMTIELDDSSSGNRNELYAKYRSPPTRAAYGYRHEASGADHRILIPRATAGEWYILVYSDYAQSRSDFTLSATTSKLLLQEIAPVRQAEDVSIVFTIFGSGFDPTVSVELIASDGTSYAPENVEVDSYTRLSASFAAGSLPVGLYTARVARDDGAFAVVDDVVEIIAGARPNLETEVILPDSLGFAQLATLYITYANTGDAPMPAPLLVLRAEQNEREAAILTLDDSRVTTGFWTSGMPEGFGSSIQILASGDTLGILQPGESRRVPVYWAGWLEPWDAGTPFEFTLSVTTVDNDLPADWQAIEEEMRPHGFNDEAWPVVLRNFQTNVGPTWGDYVRMLDENSLYLGRLGQRVVDVSELFNFELAQSNGIGPIDYLGEVQDLSVSTPGDPLTFERAHRSGEISGRYELGPFGRGWTHNWQWRLEQLDDGTVNIHDPDGLRYIFKLDKRLEARGLVGYISQREEGCAAHVDLDGSSVRPARRIAAWRAFRRRQAFDVETGQLAYVQYLDTRVIVLEYADGQLVKLTEGRDCAVVRFRLCL